MAEPLKHLYNKLLIKVLSNEIKIHYEKFDCEKFKDSVFDDFWEEKELKDRMHHIASTLNDFLPNDYLKALDILKKTAPKFNGFEHMYFQDFVEIFGLEYFEESMNALELFTQYASSEFAIRAFILKYEEKTMNQMKIWANSSNHHVRRLASEGCRPRLPWAISLPKFKENPSKVIEILDILKDDESLYVRKSVANNLNDISKDNPNIVIKLIKSWKNRNDNCDWLVKHAARSLLKNSNKEVLEIFGFADISHITLQNFDLSKNVEINSDLEFNFLLCSKKELGKLRIEYAIHFLKANGRLSKKVFMLSSVNNSSKSKVISKKHSFKKISTRKYYKGIQGLSIIVNGYKMIYKEFELK